ncbi:hypothetical protein F511_35083 [Dorcoceras hygrometricum]|uniref:Uncharacterized protein n=1 Tax=Dorcoceras hygrometricum TaxID=472368 RepID=A0A2Z7APW8_9LAMI|nr:hypothetical protein F511_35083 [Dorcoceras hygrometricum]
MGISTRQNDVLKVVHPGRHVEYFREPITAGEIMSRYPRHCLARPDFFEFPWVVVHPESVLVPGKVFYLVPYRTIYKLLNAKMEYQQEPNDLYSKHNRYSESDQHQYLIPYTKQKSPTKALAGNTPKHHYQHRIGKTQSHNTLKDQELYVYMPEQDPDAAKSSYRLSFYKSWNKMRSNLNQPLENDYHLNYGLFSPFDGGKSGIDEIRSKHWLVTSPEHAETLKPCLKMSDSARKKLKFKVSFASPVVDPGSRGD